MAWIESHQELANHPKVYRLSDLLDESVPTVIGRLHLLWYWAYDYADDGDLTRYRDSEVARACMWTGEPARLIEALLEAGFLDETWQLHDWAEYQGKWQRRREAQAERQRAYRGRQSNERVTSRSRDGATNQPTNHTNRTGLDQPDQPTAATAPAVRPGTKTRRKPGQAPADQRDYLQSEKFGDLSGIIQH